MTHRRPEDLIQRAIVAHYRARAVRDTYMFAVPNGGYRRPVDAAILKATGTIAGIPDTVWIKDGRAYLLELKPPGGRLSPAQKQAIIDLRAAGAVANVTYGLDEALERLERWGLLRGSVQ